MISLTWNLGAFAGWARTRTELNYLASVEVGRTLAPGTLVQGKLANGLSLENRIKPVFVGHGFGNYADRLTRDDVRYILTYVLPRQGYESQDGSGSDRRDSGAVPQSPHRARVRRRRDAGS